MRALPSKKFKFTVDGLAPETFELSSFSGTESISGLYRFEITLFSGNLSINLRRVIRKRATLTILRNE